MKELLRTTNPTIIPFAMAVLAQEGIEAFDLDVHMSTLEGSIGILPRRLMVRREDHFRARAIIDEYEIPLES